MRSVLAVIAGYAVMAVLVVLMSGILMSAFPTEFMNADHTPKLPRGGWYVLNLAYSFAFAIVGGWLTARMAPRFFT